MTTDTCCWPECDRPVTHTEIPLCLAHYRKAGQQFIVDRQERGRRRMNRSRLDEEARKAERLAVAIEHGRRETARRERIAEASVVYYVRTGRYIKIGYTSNLTARLSGLRLHPTAVLATEPGGRTLEAERHAQFAADRMGRKEDFVPSTGLMEHIQELQEAARE